MVKISGSIKENLSLCAYALGVAVLGYLGYRAVYWIINRCSNTERVHQIGQERIPGGSSAVTGRERYEEMRNACKKTQAISESEHLAFLKEKNITVANPSEFAEISPNRKQKIQESVILMIREGDKWPSSQDCLGEHLETVIDHFEKTFPKILNVITNFLSFQVKNKINRKPILSDKDLLASRILFFRCGGMLKQQVESELQIFELGIENEENGVFLEDLPDLIIESIFQELANGREIAYYNPRYVRVKGSVDTVNCVHF